MPVYLRRIAAALVTALVSALLVSIATPAAAVGIGTITGTVTGSGGAGPLAGVYASAYVQQSGGALAFVASAQTNASGVFSIGSLDPGQYTVLYLPGSEQPAYLSEWWDNQPTQATAQLFTVSNVSIQRSAELQRGATLSGTVTGALPGGGANNVVGASVQVYDGAQVLLRSTTTDTSGHYLVQGLPGGSYVVRFAPAGSTYAAEWYPQKASFARAQKTTISVGYDWIINTTLARATLLTGDVVDKNGDGVPSTVVVYDASFVGDSTSAAVVGTYGTSNGGFILSLRPGDYTFAATTAAEPTYGASGPAPSVGGYITQWWSQKYSVAASNTITVSSPGGGVMSGYTMRLENPAFADVPDPTSPFYESIEWMFSSNISTGTPQGGGLDPLYKPSDTVSRQSMATFLYRLSGDSFSPPSTPTFADVPTNASTFTAIEWMASEGISTGTPQSSGKPLFKPTDIVSRQSMAVFIARMAHVDTTTPSTTQVFADVPTSASTATAIEWMHDTGISTGTPQPSGLPLYKPADPVSRQAMALFLFRFGHLEM